MADASIAWGGWEPAVRDDPFPLFADMQGLSNVMAAMQRFAKNPNDDASFWEPASLLAKLADEGKNFSGPPFVRENR